MIDYENVEFLTGEYTHWNKNVAIQKIVKLKEGDEIKLTTWNSDEIDMKIIRHIFRQKKQSFYQNRKISFDMGPLVRDVYASRSVKYYEEVEKRLFNIIKMSYMMKVERREAGSKGGELSWSLFVMLKVDKDSKVAEVVVSEIAFEQVLIEERLAESIN